MSEDEARAARARRLREEIERLRGSMDSDEERPAPAPTSPREFTDAAAARAASEAAASEGDEELAPGNVPDPDGEQGSAPLDGPEEGWVRRPE